MVTVHLLHRGEPYPPTDFITPILSIIILGSTDIEIAAKTRLDGTNWSADPTPVNHQGGRHITTGDHTFSVYHAAPFIHLLEVFTVKKSYTFFGKIAG